MMPKNKTGERFRIRKFILIKRAITGRNVFHFVVNIADPYLCMYIHGPPFLYGSSAAFTYEYDKWLVSCEVAQQLLQRLKRLL